MGVFFLNYFYLYMDCYNVKLLVLSLGVFDLPQK